MHLRSKLDRGCLKVHMIWASGLLIPNFDSVLRSMESYRPSIGEASVLYRSSSLTKCRPTDVSVYTRPIYWQILGRVSTDMSTDSRPSVDRVSTDMSIRRPAPIVDRVSTDILTDPRPSVYRYVDRVSIDNRVVGMIRRNVPQLPQIRENVVHVYTIVHVYIYLSTAPSHPGFVNNLK